jgi:hypothetical protein
MAHIGNVLDIQNFVTDEAQIANDYVKGDIALCVTDMRVAIDCRSADIHSNATFVKRFEFFLPPRECIMNLNCHTKWNWMVSD